MLPLSPAARVRGSLDSDRAPMWEVVHGFACLRAAELEISAFLWRLIEHAAQIAAPRLVTLKNFPHSLAVVITIATVLVL